LRSCAVSRLEQIKFRAKTDKCSLMEHYDLRSCFLPDLSGLHVRIYQFRELLKSHLPKLNAHLELLQVEPTYVSQWFLSFFAVTCPLPMLFRIYDVIFAEGASETIMRVALSVMRKNEEKILACTEFEDIMQLLLSRGLWDCYHYNADEFVNDFVSLTGVVTNESLQALKASYQDARALGVTATPSFDVGSAASRFLGRLWSGSTTTTKSANLSPGLTAPARPVSFLRRSPSKQSIASTLNSAEGGSESVLSSTSTDATTVSRDSSNTDSSSIRVQSTMFSNIMVPAPKTSTNNDRNLHGQIEDLLTALSELQRENTILETQLQREREQRDEDGQTVRSLLDGLRRKGSSDSVKTAASEGSLETVTLTAVEDAGNLREAEHDKDPTCESFGNPESDATKCVHDKVAVSGITQEALSHLIDAVEVRFAKQNNRRSSMPQSKSQLRDELVRSKEKLILEVSKSQELSRRLNDMEQDIYKLKEQVKEGHSHARNAYQEKQRLEKQILELKARKTPINPSEAAAPAGESEWPRRASGHGGLRELRLGRPISNLSQTTTFSKRTSSLNIQLPTGKENEIPSPTTEAPPTPVADVDALVLELVQAKTAEAEAKAETEVLKAKLESLKRMLGTGDVESPGHRPSPSQPNMTLGAFSSYMSRGTDSRAITPAVTSSSITTPSIITTSTATPSAASGGGFWTGWGRRTASTGQAAVLPERI
jgi:septal ring factor EnvC (AmiA/AmiB activator)